MQLARILKKLLRIKDIVIEDVVFEGVGLLEQLVIKARLPRRKKHRCPICGRKVKRYDSGRGRRRWRSLDLGTTRVYIEACATRVVCPEHGVHTEQVSWARHGAAFTYDFENTTAWLSLHSSIKVVAELMRIAWNTVGPVIARVHNDLKAKEGHEYDGLVAIGIDETSYKKGYKYMTVVVDHGTGRIVWAAKGHGKAVLDGFFALLDEEQRKTIRHVTADGARWIAESVAEWCPKAELSIDPFHVVQWATTVLDEVRRAVWNETRGDVKSGKAKRKRGRPRTGEEPEKETASGTIKGARYPLSKNPENLTTGQAATIELLAKSNTKLYRAYLLKEKLRLLFRHPYRGARQELEDWVAWARHCRIPQFVELQKKIMRHAESILSTIKYGLSNARVEAINNKIKLTIRMGYGFRNIDNLIAMVMLRCSGIDLPLPGRSL